MASSATRRKKKMVAGRSSSGNSKKKPRASMDLGAIVDSRDANDDYIDSDDESDDEVHHKRRRSTNGNDDSSVQQSEDGDTGYDEENIDVKRVRLAREYLQNIDARSDESSASSGGNDDDDDDDEKDDDGDDHNQDGNKQVPDHLARKLQRERLKKQGVLERNVAMKLLHQVAALTEQVAVIPRTTDLHVPKLDQDAQLQAEAWVNAGHVQLGHGHDLTPTCVALQQLTGELAVSGSKDHSVLLWDVESLKHLSTICSDWKSQKKSLERQRQQPTSDLTSASISSSLSSSRTAGQVMSVALSDNGRYAAVGSRDGLVRIFDVRVRQTSNLVKTFEGHKAAVTCLAFRTQSLQLFSGSEDRCIRHFNLDDMLYVETLYGHQFGVTDIDCYRKERPVSVGRDRTVRAWKLAQDTHLIYRGGSKIQFAESVSIIKDDWFLTGHEGGHLCLWTTDKKRAVATVENAHGTDEHGLGRPVTSVCAFKGGDVAVTGSHDGVLRFWQVSPEENRNIESLCHVPLYGYVNGLAFGPKARFCLAAVGQEHRSGRWYRIPKAKNRLALVRLHNTATDSAADNDFNEADSDENKRQNDKESPEQNEIADPESSSRDSDDNVGNDSDSS